MVTPHYLKKCLKYWTYERSEPSCELQAELIKIAHLSKKEFDEERERLELELKVKYEDD